MDRIFYRTSCQHSLCQRKKADSLVLYLHPIPLSATGKCLTESTQTTYLTPSRPSQTNVNFQPSLPVIGIDQVAHLKRASQILSFHQISWQSKSTPSLFLLSVLLSLNMKSPQMPVYKEPQNLLPDMKSQSTVNTWYRTTGNRSNAPMVLTMNWAHLPRFGKTEHVHGTIWKKNVARYDEKILDLSVSWNCFALQDHDSDLHMYKGNKVKHSIR